MERVAAYCSSGTPPFNLIFVDQKKKKHGEAEHPSVVIQRQDGSHHLSYISLGLNVSEAFLSIHQKVDKVLKSNCND